MVQIYDLSNNVVADVTASGQLLVTTATGSSTLYGATSTIARGLALVTISSGGKLYYCDAEPGTAWTSASWRISRRIQLTGSGITNGNFTQWASGNSNFDKKATLATLYPYS